MKEIAADRKQQVIELLTEKSNSELLRFVEDTKKLMSYYRCAILEVETKFRVLNEELSMAHDRNPIESIKTRLKSFESIQDKCRRKGIPLEPGSIEEHLNDIAGIRIICGFLDDIYMLADALVQQDDVELVKKKDYIQNPKPNGYRSLHLIVKVPIFLCDEKKYVNVEVQLRTIAMESWANLEHHMRYKKNLTPEVTDQIDAELAECARLSNALDRRMQNVRTIIEDYRNG